MPTGAASSAFLARAALSPMVAPNPVRYPVFLRGLSSVPVLSVDFRIPYAVSVEYRRSFAPCYLGQLVRAVTLSHGCTVARLHCCTVALLHYCSVQPDIAVVMKNADARISWNPNLLSAVFL